MYVAVSPDNGGTVQFFKNVSSHNFGKNDRTKMEFIWYE